MQEQVPLEGWIQVKRGTRARVCVYARARVIQLLKVTRRECALLEFLQRLCSLIVCACVCAPFILFCKFLSIANDFLIVLLLSLTHPYS